MKIQVDAQEMLHVLVDAGIDANDAKAIILDLIMATEKKKTPKVVDTQLAMEDPGLKTKVREKEEGQLGTEGRAPEAEAEARTAVKVSRSQVRRSEKPANFSFMGGPAEPLR